MKYLLRVINYGTGTVESYDRLSQNFQKLAIESTYGDAFDLACVHWNDYEKKILDEDTLESSVQVNYFFYDTEKPAEFAILLQTPKVTRCKDVVISRYLNRNDSSNTSL